MTLTEFLLARIAEDGADARAVVDADYASYSASWSQPWSGEVDTGDGLIAAVGDRNVAAHIARWDPARVLAECEAKRRIVAECDSTFHMNTPPASTNSEAVWVAEAVLQLLARPYASHPDFNPAWRP